MPIRALSTLLISLMLLPTFAVANSCQAQLHLLETLLFQQPDNQTLLQEYQTLQATNCQAPKSQALQSTQALEFSLGYHSNANQQTRHNSIDFIFDEQVYNFTIAEKPQPSWFHALSINGQQPLDNQSGFQYWLQGTHFQEQSIQDTYEFGVTYYHQPYAHTLLETSLWQQYLNQLHSRWISLSAKHALNQNTQLQLNTAIRRHPSRSEFDANTYGMSWIHHNDQQALWLQYQSETPLDQNYLGGGSRQYTLGLNQNNLTMIYKRQQDQQQYSQLFGSTKRQIDSFLLSYDIELSQKNRQNTINLLWDYSISNIKLFERTTYKLQWQYFWEKKSQM